MFEINGLSVHVRISGGDEGELPSIEIVDEDFSSPSLERQFETVEDILRIISDYTKIPVEMICGSDVSALLFRMGVRLACPHRVVQFNC